VFISIHVNAEENKNEHSGLSVLIPKNDNPYLKQSQLLGSALVQSFESNYQLPVAAELQQQEEGVWVLKANECPSVLVEAGYITTQKDLDYLLNPDNQKKIAADILNGIENMLNKIYLAILLQVPLYRIQCRLLR
jgi:N-acetylmuramoyl-L-alanine amidase